MAEELEIIKRMASVKVQDRHGPVVKERGGALVTRRRGWSNDICLWDLGTGAGSYMRWHRMDVTGASLEVDRLM